MARAGVMFFVNGVMNDGGGHISNLAHRLFKADRADNADSYSFENDPQDLLDPHDPLKNRPK